MKPFLLLCVIPTILAIGLGIGLDIDKRRQRIANIEHDGHLFIQSKTSTIHSPRCSCQSSLKAMSSQAVKQAID